MKAGAHRARRAELNMWLDYLAAWAGRLWFLGCGILALAGVLIVLWILDVAL